MPVLCTCDGKPVTYSHSSRSNPSPAPRNQYNKAERDTLLAGSSVVAGTVTGASSNANPSGYAIALLLGIATAGKVFGRCCFVFLNGAVFALLSQSESATF